MLDYLKTHSPTPIKDIPYSKNILDQLVKQGLIEYQKQEVYRKPLDFFQTTNQDIILTNDQQKVVDWNYCDILKELPYYMGSLVQEKQKCI